MKKILKKILSVTLSLSLTSCSYVDQAISLFDDQKAHINEVLEQKNDIIPNLESRYYLSQLEDNELAFVLLAYEGLMNFEQEIQVNIQFEDQNRPQQLLELMQYDCPEIYQFTTNSTSSVVAFSWIERKKELVSFNVEYILDQETYEASKMQIEDTIHTLVQEAKTFCNNDFEKELYIYDYIADNCVYDAETIHNSSAYGVLIDYRSACLGISRTFQWILNELKIPCITVGGYAKNEDSGHAWNIVKLDDEYYSVDLTADTQQVDLDNYKLYLYLNVTDDEVRSKYNLSDSLFNVPETTATRYNYYIYNDLIAYTYDEAYEKVNNEIMNVLYEGYGFFNLKIEDPQAYTEIIGGIADIYNDCLAQTGLYRFNASYANSEEYQILHFQLN